MLTLAYPWMLFLLPAPLPVFWFAPAHREERGAVVVPFFQILAGQSGEKPGEGAVVPQGSWWRNILLLGAWACLVLAIARPQWIEPPLTKSVPVRDLLLAVDLSGSMATRDFTDEQGKKTDRLTAVKKVLDDFLSGRKGDRVGLIFFGSAPFVQAPFTEDAGVCRRLLDEAQVGMAGPQTALGDAIGLAITVFDRSEVRERVLIALTDGNDTASNVPPAKAAEIAKDKGIIIHTVAVGDPRAAGEDALDVDTLRKVAGSTGGLYSFANDRSQLSAIYKQLDGLQPHQAQTITHHPRRDIYYWPLLLGLVLTLLHHAFRLMKEFHPRAARIPLPERAAEKKRREEEAVV